MKLKSVLWRFTFALLSYLSVCLGEFVVVSSLTSDTSTQKFFLKATDAFHFWAMWINSMRNYSSVNFNYFNSRYYPPPSFNNPHTMNAMVVVPKKKKTWWFNAADSLSFLPRTLAWYFTAKRINVSQLRWSCDTFRAQERQQNKTAWCDAHFSIFF